MKYNVNDPLKIVMREPFWNTRKNAALRGIKWLLEFDDYVDMWFPYWLKRGHGRGGFILCRRGHAGPFSRENCYIGKRSDYVRLWHKVRVKPIRKAAQAVPAADPPVPDPQLPPCIDNRTASR